MPKDKSVDEMTDDAIRQGGYLAMVYFDLHGTTPDAVKNLMVGFIGKLTREPGVIYAVGEIDKPIEKEGMFSTWAEVKLLASDFPTLVKIAAQYSPIGVEILRPGEVRMTLGEAQGSLLDVSQTSQNFTRLIMERMLSEGEKKDYATKLSQRIALGKKLFENKR
ncbi:MAG: hypothetical protein NTX79_05695 [Candidatus Micrarchaeota archaeon]|nr:hypothetical protein [Candidatus Micrarchaeota archaeon]